jgi:[NiFe] hydrogenase assembly HybE family chaperone
MPSANPRQDERPSPAAALERRFKAILQQQMQGVPMVNPALQVQAVGFQAWNDHWLGVLVTPWFMNLMLLPRVAERWQPIAERESRHYVFPAGVFEFIGSRDAELGDYQACSLFSPMFDFATQAGAADTAAAALQALFDTANRPAIDLPAAAADPVAPPTQPVPVVPLAPAAAAGHSALTPQPPAVPALSKRDFLFGSAARADRGP